MEWLKALNVWVWATLSLLAGGAIFAQFAMPLFAWVWGFVVANAMVLIALAVIAGVSFLAAGHSHKES